MPFLSLDLKCNLVGVTDLAPMDPESFRWHLKLSFILRKLSTSSFQVKCTNCGEAPDNWIYVVVNEMLEVPGSRGEANLVHKCKLCNRMNTLTILPDTVGKYTMEDNEKWQPMVVFDCRGVEPYEFDLRNDWEAKACESNNVFSDIDLTEKIWADYDEKSGESVEINEIEARFAHSKVKK